MSVTFTVFCVLSSIFTQAQNEYDVIIMGAGGSGIAAAKTLYEANITNILIIEAQDYIGGRTKIMNFSNYSLNIGASWISGACINESRLNCSQYHQTNPMVAAAYKYNFSFVFSDYVHGFILDPGGTQHNITDTNNRYAAFYDAQECASNIIKNVSRYNPSDMSYFAALSLCGWTTPHRDIDKTIQWVVFDFEAQHAKWSTSGSHGSPDSGTYSAYGPDDLFITDPRGFQGILLALASEFLDIDNINNEDKIILESPITTIEYNENGVIVTLDNNDKYSADYGIVRFSLGVLQSDIIEFIPKLPDWKIDSILAFDFINYTPIVIKWPVNFWSDNVPNNSEFIIFNEDRFGFFPWVYNLDYLFPGSLIWRFDITLDLAEMVQYQNINDTIREIIDLKLAYYFDNVPQPENIVVGEWNINRYIQGSFSNWPPGFDDNDRDAMSWSLQRLFFSGEAFSDFDYAFVHTAWLSGNETANKILACMGYNLELTNGYECPEEYIPPSDDNDCGSMNESVWKEFVWLWIILGVLFGIILGIIFAKYCIKIGKNQVYDKQYGSVDDRDVPMVAQNTSRQ